MARSIDDNSLPLDTIVQGDCVEVMCGLPAGSVDLIFADPPYNLQLRQPLYRPDRSEVDAVDDHWDQFGSFEEYDAFTRDWLAACRHVLKETGTLWVIGSYHNIYRVGAILQDLGYWILNDIAWVKTNPMPQFRGVRFCNAHETLIWAKRSQTQKRYTFNYHGLKAANDDLQVRSDWRLPICTGGERLRDSAGDDKVHATQKPEALLRRIITACSNPGDVVLDPFFGSGTTGAAAKRLGRHYIGIEREPHYIEAARSRIDAVEPFPEASLDWPESPIPRVPFASLLDLDLIQPGDALRLGNRDVYATVLANGSVRCGDETGSIHRVGATMLGTPGCNGWEHWRYREAATGEYRLLDELRVRARQMLNAGEQERTESPEN